MKSIQFIIVAWIIIIFVSISCNKKEKDQPNPSLPISQFAITYRPSYIYNDIIVKSMIQADEGNFLLIGMGLIVKININGEVLWSKKFNDCSLKKIIKSNDGGYALTGTFYNSISSHDILLLKLDKDCNQQWVKTIGGTGYDHGYDIVQTIDDGYAIIGETNSFSTGGMGVEYYIIKVDLSGNVQWTRTFGKDGYDSGSSIAVGNDGAIYVGGNFSRTKSSSRNSSSSCVVKFNINGENQWATVLISNEYNQCNSIISTEDGGVLFVGNSGDPFEKNKTYVGHVDSNGTLSWCKTFGLPSNNYGWSVIELADNSYLIAGETNNNSGGAFLNRKVLLLKINSFGDFLSGIVIRDKNSIAGLCLIETQDNGCLVGGLIAYPPDLKHDKDVFKMHNYNFFVLKLENSFSSCMSFNPISPLISNISGISTDGFIGSGGIMQAEALIEDTLSVTMNMICSK